MALTIIGKINVPKNNPKFENTNINPILGPVSSGLSTTSPTEDKTIAGTLIPIAPNKTTNAVLLVNIKADEGPKTNKVVFAVPLSGRV
ncbi:MAG: hypothetical protein AAGU27_00145 [Dehalobacterium sp.]